MSRLPESCTAFEGHRRIASGPLEDVAVKAKRIVDKPRSGPVLIFDDDTSEQCEVDFRGTAKDVLERIQNPGKALAQAMATASEPRAPGRPKLGVVAREVTLLPRHWDWLGSQPGGASVALRKLVDEARRVNARGDRVRRAREVCYRFMSAMAGDLVGFEEVTRALFAGDQPRFDELTDRWPTDIAAHTRKLAAAAFTTGD